MSRDIDEKNGRSDMLDYRRAEGGPPVRHDGWANGQLFIAFAVVAALHVMAGRWMFGADMGDLMWGMLCFLFFLVYGAMLLVAHATFWSARGRGPEHPNPFTAAALTGVAGLILIAFAASVWYRNFAW